MRVPGANVAGAAALMVVLAGCTSAPAPSVTAGTSATSALPRVTAPGIASPLPSGSASAGWSRIVGATSGIELTVPPGWEQVSLPQLRQQLEQLLPAVTGPPRASLAWVVELIDSGRLDLAAVGPSPGSIGMPSSILVTVDQRDEQLTAAVDRLLAEMNVLGGSHVVEQSDIQLRVGPAVRVLTAGGGPGTVPSQGITLIYRSLDGRTVSIVGTAPATDPSFVQSMDQVAALLP